jgi:hypothetical protein
MPTAIDKNEHYVKERIVNDLRNHEITVLHSDGLYRHWRCQKPGDSNMYFDIVTWPGSLCFTGDMGEYLFQRTSDMVAFMRSSCMSYCYAAEKCVAHDGRLKEFSEDLFEEILKEAEVFDDDHDYLSSKERAAWIAARKDKTAEIRQRFHERSEDASEAMWAMYESGIWDGCDMPSCEVYTFHFLWCLHAIKWFCDKIAVPEMATPTLDAANPVT